MFSNHFECAPDAPFEPTSSLSTKIAQVVRATFGVSNTARKEVYGE